MSIQVFEILEQTFDNLPEYLLFELDGYTPDSKLPNDIKEGTSIIQESCHELIHEYIETWDNNYIKGYMRELIYLADLLHMDRRELLGEAEMYLRTIQNVHKDDVLGMVAGEVADCFTNYIQKDGQEDDSEELDIEIQSYFQL